MQISYNQLMRPKAISILLVTTYISPTMKNDYKYHNTSSIQQN